LATYLVHGHFLEGALGAIAGIVYQDADSALFLLDEIDAALDTGSVADVELQQLAPSGLEITDRIEIAGTGVDRIAGLR
jgi:hypothetical protein